MNTNKTALITGASGGLGTYIARCLWNNGFNLILVARSHEKLTFLAKELFTHSHQYIKIVPCDLNDPASLDGCIQQTKHEVDILINNAAIQGPIGPIWENDWQAWQSTLQVNLLAPIQLCRAYLPLMQAKKYGKIINLSGGGATNARPNFSAYAVAKAGLIRFSETLAEEVKPFNIDVNCIAPGIMNTDMLKAIIHAGPTCAGEKEYQTAQATHQRDSSIMENAAELCHYLASSRSDGITGKLISAIWDPWRNLATFKSDLCYSDIYTLRRITPQDRGKTWGKI